MTDRGGPDGDLRALAERQPVLRLYRRGLPRKALQSHTAVCTFVRKLRQGAEPLGREEKNDSCGVIAQF